MKMFDGWSPVKILNEIGSFGGQLKKEKDWDITSMFVDLKNKKNNNK